MQPQDHNEISEGQYRGPNSAVSMLDQQGKQFSWLIPEHRFLLHGRLRCICRAMVFQPSVSRSNCYSPRRSGYRNRYKKTFTSRAYWTCEFSSYKTLQSSIGNVRSDTIEWSVVKPWNALVRGWLPSPEHSHSWEHETLIDRKIPGGNSRFYKASSRESVVLHVLQYALREIIAWCCKRVRKSWLEIRWN